MILFMLPARTYSGDIELLKFIAAKKPQVIGFGEYHPGPDYEGRTTLEIFSCHLLPILANLGYKKIVVEYLYLGLSQTDYELCSKNSGDPAKQQAMQDNLLRAKDPKGLLALFKEAQRCGVDIFGAWPNDFEKNLRFSQISGKHNPERINALEMFSISRVLTRNMIAIAERLFENQENALLYGGLWHSQCKPRLEQISYGLHFILKNINYLEVVLINSGLLKNFDEIDRGHKEMVKNKITERISPDRRTYELVWSE